MLYAEKCYGFEAKASIIRWVTNNKNGTVTQIFCQPEAFLYEFGTDATISALQFHRKRCQQQSFKLGARGNNVGFCEHNVADDLAVFFRHQRKLRDVVAAFSESIYIVLFVSIGDFGGLKGNLN
jgi:hypothetical protein